MNFNRQLKQAALAFFCATLLCCNSGSNSEYTNPLFTNGFRLESMIGQIEGTTYVKGVRFVYDEDSLKIDMQSLDSPSDVRLFYYNLSGEITSSEVKPTQCDAPNSEDDCSDYPGSTRDYEYDFAGKLTGITQSYGSFDPRKATVSYSSKGEIESIADSTDGYLYQTYEYLNGKLIRMVGSDGEDVYTIFADTTNRINSFIKNDVDLTGNFNPRYKIDLEYDAFKNPITLTIEDVSSDDSHNDGKQIYLFNYIAINNHTPNMGLWRVHPANLFLMAW